MKDTAAMRSRLIALAASAALFCSPAMAAPVWAPSQGGAVGPNVACTNQNGDAIRCIQPSVTLNDATGAAMGTVGNPVAVSGSFTPSGTGDYNLKQVNGATVNVGTGAAGTGTQRVTTSTDSTIGTVTALTTLTGGAVAAGATDSGNPLKIGGKYTATPPTLTDGQRGDAQLDASSNLKARVLGNVQVDTDARSNTVVGFGGSSAADSDQRLLITAPHRFNGSNWDREFTCANSATINVTAGNTTQIVALSGSTVTRVCSIAISMSAAGSAGVYTGTGTNCGTGTTAVIQDMALATGTPYAQSAPAGGSLVRSSAGGEICVKAVTGNVTGFLSYSQF